MASSALITKKQTKKTEKMSELSDHLVNVEFMVRIINDACLSKNYTGAKDIAVQLAAENARLVTKLQQMHDEQERAIFEDKARRGTI